MIEIKNLTKIYPRGKKKALDNVNVKIPNGIFGLIGRNGAGKTTLMRQYIKQKYGVNAGEALYCVMDSMFFLYLLMEM